MAIISETLWIERGTGVTVAYRVVPPANALRLRSRMMPECRVIAR